MENWQEIVETALKEPILKSIKLDKGLTNDNYRILTQNHDCVVRVPRSDSHQTVRRSHEAKAMALIQALDLDVKTLYYSPETGLKISVYVDNLKTFDEYHEKDRIQRTARLMRKLHSLKTCAGVIFDPVQRYHQYRSHVKRPMVDDETSQSIVSLIEDFDHPMTLCHNDWVAGNICFGSKRDYLIDYEYAGDNDPFFDVMSFLTENDLTKAEKEEFILAYFGRKPSPEEYDRLFAYQQFHNLLWCTWAVMMFESRHETIYQEIAQMKYDALVLDKI